MLLMCSLSLWAEILLSYYLWCHLIIQFFLLINPCRRKKGTLYISLWTLAFLLERVERLFEVAVIFCLRIGKHHIYSWDICFKLVGLKSSLWQMRQSISICKKVYHLFFRLFYCLIVLQIEACKVQLQIMQLWIQLFWRKIWYFSASIHFGRRHQVIFCHLHFDLVLTCISHLGCHGINSLFTLIIKCHRRSFLSFLLDLLSVFANFISLLDTDRIWQSFFTITLTNYLNQIPRKVVFFLLFSRYLTPKFPISELSMHWKRTLTLRISVLFQSYDATLINLRCSVVYWLVLALSLFIISNHIYVCIEKVFVADLHSDLAIFDSLFSSTHLKLFFETLKWIVLQIQLLTAQGTFQFVCSSASLSLHLLACGRIQHFLFWIFYVLGR